MIWETRAVPRVGPEVRDAPPERDRAALPELPEDVLERPDRPLPLPVEPVSPKVVQEQEMAAPMQQPEPSVPAETQGPHPAAVVFLNATLTMLATHFPRTMVDLIGLPGLGAKHIEAYGERILDAIDTELDE